MRPTLEGRLLSPDPLTYRAAGVDITAGDEAVRRIARLAASTHRPEVLGGVEAERCGAPLQGFFKDRR